MEATEKFAKISVETNPDTGEVTLYISNEPWGPVVTGKNLAEAKAKMKDAFGIAMLANSYCDSIRLQNNHEAIKEKMTEYNNEVNKVNKTLEYAL